MVCSDQRRRDEEKARAALEQMSDEALAGMIKMMQETALRNPRLDRAKLTVVQIQEGDGPKK